jgi:hypothetical protein
LHTEKEQGKLHVYALTFEGTIGNIIAIYRNLRENFEYRLRYDKAGEFFIREMELKRNYRDDRTNYKFRNTNGIRARNIILRNISMTGLYYRLSKYGHDFIRPSIFGAIVIMLSIVFTSGLYNSFLFLVPLNNATFQNIEDATERSITTFIQFRGEQLIWQDYIIKALGILTLGLLAIPLRRRFERKFRH